MARIHALPSLEIIRGLKGILDFYVWRGLPCVRAWPQYRPARQTDASLAAALLFGAIIKAYSLTYSLVLEQLAIEATGIPRTGRDITVSGIYGNLHEASMSDFLDLLTECRDSLSALTTLLNALHDVGLDELDVHVHATVLPPDAATHTGQGTQLTALQKIDDLQDALESKALDRLLARGMDQLFSLKNALTIDERIADAAAGTNELTPGAVPANEYWVITHLWAVDETTAITRIETRLVWNGTTTRLHAHLPIAPFDGAIITGPLILPPESTLFAIFFGCVLHDSLRLSASGHAITLET